MDETVQRAVERAIATMRARLGERLTVDDLARAALFSKFHFSRVFQQTTGVSPGRFLSAMRLDEAKRLLLRTSITVADISHRVGYNSVGTFSTRFSLRVGVSPIVYRQLGGITSALPGDVVPDARGTRLRGQVRGPADAADGLIFVGLFPGRIPEGRPVRYTVLDRPGPYCLGDVPDGRWYLIGHRVAAPVGFEIDHAEPYTGCQGPLAIRSGTGVCLADLRLHPRRPVDPPLLLALPDLRADLAAASMAAA